ncbi:hypothetical protein K7H20_23565 [Salipiger manganoxidans]|uniref:hypothetical protein n=1 Tax=Salipiger marinus TaxID=555512 RepID=UPI001E3146FE|nr:hypothetical protein [Salipiger manganoxidans]MCD1621027.1 hypothetical protein [Salipiger manganoxidans]
MALIIPLTGADFDDNSLPVIARDSLARVGSQVIFDFADAACWPGGAPGAADVVASLGPLDIYSGGFLASQPGYNTGRMIFGGLSGSADAIQIVKAGASGVPFFPSGDGDYRDLLAIVWVSVTAYPASNAGVWGFGRSGGVYVGPGLQMTASGLLQDKLSGGTTGITLVPGQMTQVALHVEYDEGAGTSQITSYRNGMLVATRSGANPATLIQDANSRAYLGGAAGNTSGLNGAVARFVVEYPSESGLNPEQRVSDDFATHRERLGA